MSSNAAPADDNTSNDVDPYKPPKDICQPWYPSTKHLVITNERRPGRLTKREKKRIRASLLPVLPNPDDGAEYVMGGRYAKTPEQLDAEFAEQLKLEKAMREEEMRRMGIEPPADNSGGGAASSSGSDGSATGGGGRGAGGVRLSYGGMRGIGRARGGTFTTRGGRAPN